jgi:hypothetical protein
VAVIFLTERPHHAFAFHVDFFSTGIPLILAFVTPVIGYSVRKLRGASGTIWDNWWMPLGAGLAWFWAIQLPNIPVTNASQTSLMHFIGGAVVGPLVYFYFVRTGRFRLPARICRRALLFYGAVFGLFGVGNEVLEFTLVKLKLYDIDLSDTVWDLAADIVGCSVAFVVIELFRRQRQHLKKGRTPASTAGQ